MCLEFFPQPVAAPGYYALSMTEFTPCVPTSACPGINMSALLNHTFSLAPFYTGNLLNEQEWQLVRLTN